MTLTLMEPEGIPPEPKPAATVVLLRDGADGPEAFLLRRKLTASFMPGAYVFPGGMVDPEDASLHHDPFLVAAVRECFEEAGILLATNGMGEHPESRPQWEQIRREVLAKPSYFREFLGEQDLNLALGMVKAWSWWLTPEIEKRRFDTRFYVARVPERQRGEHDGDETTASCWIPVAQALRRYQAGEIDMAPPTVATLVEMAPFQTTDEVLAQAPWDEALRFPVFAKNPNNEIVILLPGDPEYPRAAKAVRGLRRVTWSRGRWWVS